MIMSFIIIKLTSAFSNNDITDDTHNTYDDISNNKIIHKIYNSSNFDIITPKTKNPAEKIDPKTKVNKLTCPEELGMKNPTTAEANNIFDKSTKYLEKISNCCLASFNSIF